MKTTTYQAIYQDNAWSPIIRNTLEELQQAVQEKRTMVENDMDNVTNKAYWTAQYDGLTFQKVETQTVYTDIV